MNNPFNTHYYPQSPYPQVAYPNQPYPNAQPYPNRNPYDYIAPSPSPYQHSECIDPQQSILHNIAQQKRDAEIARILQEGERKRIEEEEKKKARRAYADMLIAKKLVEDEEKEIAEAERKREEEARLLEELRLEEERAKKIEQDAALARRLQAEFDRERTQFVSAPKRALTYNERMHMIAVHNKHCFCRDTGYHNNNHIVKIHDNHCVCFNKPVKYANEGRVHVHGYRCCLVNHIHTIRCRCIYRDHKHNRNQCCAKNHIHTKRCHCVNK